MALGVGRPYWAVVTAASVFQANAALSWQRALQRVVGNLLGLLLFTALLPLSRTGQLAVVLLGLLCQFGAEALIARSYWLASVFVTPMALLMTSFGGQRLSGTLVTDRWLDTCIGALAGLTACLVVTNRRTTTRLDRAIATVQAAMATAQAAAPAPQVHAPLSHAPLSHALVELREAADTASGEWWQRALPQDRIAATEQEGHRLLATLVQQRGTRRPPPASRPIGA
ncbi:MULTISPECIES: FUSC family protein [unclassified Kitasatospora]|uniref:FUSC family protein n=1 Tax=unclassified Kitasatospora TaxID=2633591 RepID=UPI0032AE9686